MSVALRDANSRALVIVDEFGQGTSPIDGSSILIALLEYWMERGLQSPLVLAATHLHSAAAYLSRSTFAPRARLMSMAWTLQDEQLVFLYKPTHSLCANSFPFSVARAAGIPESVVIRGQEVCPNWSNFLFYSLIFYFFVQPS